jgi:hypothetical protein
MEKDVGVVVVVLEPGQDPADDVLQVARVAEDPKLGLGRVKEPAQFRELLVQQSLEWHGYTFR